MRAAFALLFGAACACPASAQGGDPAAFDTLFRRLDLEDIATLDAAGTERELSDLERLLPPGDVHRALLARSLRCNWGYRDDARAQRTAAEAGLHDARAAADGAAEIRFLYCRAGAREQVDTPLQALPDYNSGIALARRLEDDRLLADGLVARGSVQSLLGEQGRAVLDFLVAQRLYERTGLKDDAEANLLNLAIAYRRMGDAGKAMDYLRQNETFAAGEKDWNGLSVNLMQQGFLYEDQNRPDDALTVYQRALTLARAQDSRYDVGAAHLGMALPYILKRQFARALHVLGQAQAEFAAVGDGSNQDMIDLRRGQALAGLGRHAQALANYDRAAASFERGANLRYLSMLYQARAASHEALGHADAALADFKRYVTAREALTGSSRSQQAEVLRFQFDASRRDLENRRLVAEKALHERQLDALLKARRWQWTALLLGALLLALLGALVVRQLVRMRGLNALALTDPLTGVANRRHIERYGEEAIARVRASGEPLTALAFDIDHFKRVNDARGHVAGDRVLARVAQACQDALRQCDVLGRIGGEEFLVLLPNTRLDQALPIAERLRMAVSALNLADVGGDLAVTISLGMAEFVAGEDLEALVRRADHALYRAKERGRDRVEVAA